MDNIYMLSNAEITLKKNSHFAAGGFYKLTLLYFKAIFESKVSVIEGTTQGIACRIMRVRFAPEKRLKDDKKMTQHD